MTKRKWWFFLIPPCLSLCVCMVYPLISLQLMRHVPVNTRGLFSWSSDQLSADGRQALFSVMDQMDLDTLYQSISSETDHAVVYSFLEDAAQHDISVWLLTGHPDWGLDPTGHAMVEEVRRAASYQSSLPKEIRFRGILMDCEPYLTDLWDSSPEQVMDCWCAAMEAARTAANGEGLLFAACIPYYLDDVGFSGHLQQLVNTGCDSLTIMNYYKNNEARHIETEIRLASRAGIPVTVIYELQPPGEHGLLDINTYYSDGLTAVEDSWRALRQLFGKNQLSIAFHEYTALQEVLARE